MGDEPSFEHLVVSSDGRTAQMQLWSQFEQRRVSMHNVATILRTEDRRF